MWFATGVKQNIYLASTGWRSWDNSEISTIAHMPYEDGNVTFPRLPSSSLIHISYTGMKDLEPVSSP